MVYSDYQRYKSAKIVAEQRKEAGLGPLPTSADIEGPFYKAGAPFLPLGRLVPDDQFPLHMLHVHGTVTDTLGKTIQNAVLDFWQANEKGEYDNVGFKFRGKVSPDSQSAYKLFTLRPGDYQIGPSEFRCAHIHVKIDAPGCKPLTTQLYFLDDKYNTTDQWFDASRVISPDGSFDFVLARA